MNKVILDKLVDDYMQAKILYYSGISGAETIYYSASILNHYCSRMHTMIYLAIEDMRANGVAVTRQSIMSTLNDTQSSP